MDRQAQEKALGAINRIFKDMGFDDSTSVVVLPGGAKLILKPSQNAFRHWECEGWKFAYTPWKDEDGWYWSWVYKPVGEGARSGEAKRWTAIKAVRFRSRKKAKQRAYDRLVKFSNRNTEVCNNG